MYKKLGVAIAASFLFLTACSAGDKSDHFGKAQSLNEEFRYSEAAVEYKKAINGDSKKTDAYIELSEILIKKLQYDEAQNILEQGINFADSKERIFIQLGKLGLLKKDYAYALENFDKAIEINPDNQDTVLGKLVALSQSADQDRLVKYTEKRESTQDSYEVEILKSFVVLPDFDKALAHIESAEHTAKDKDLTAKLKTLVESAKKDPKTKSENYMKLSREIINFGNASFATPLIDEVIKDNKFYEGGYLYKGIILYTIGSYNEAEVKLKESLKYNSKLAEGYRYLALVQMKQKKYDESAANFANAVKFEAKDKEGVYKDYYHMSTISKNTKLQENNLSKLIEVTKKSNPSYILELGKLYCINGDNAKLESTLKDLAEDKLKSESDKSEYNALVGCKSYLGNDLSKAKASLSKAEGQYKGSAFVYYVAFLAHRKDNNIQESDNYKTRTIDVDLKGLYTDMTK